MRLIFIISGSIAIKKCKNILKKLTTNGVYVDCILTKNASKMLRINSLQKDIKGKIYLDSSENKKKMLHITLSRKANLIVVCPATANLIAKFSHGIADDLASTTLIASNKQILFMPAMNVEMWNNKINKRNVLSLQKKGVEFVGPDYGFLSCGEVGLGRLTSEKKIIQVILDYLNKSQKLNKIKCLVTAGPTIEPIDAIRFISNYSSGKQGYEIARQLMLAGANVSLISGPTNLPAPTNVKLIKVKTADEMNKKVLNHKYTDVAIFTAAVSDVSAIKKIKSKIKKEKLNKILLKKNPDIISNFTSKKINHSVLVIGFAAETNNHIKNAKLKLKHKNCDYIVVNKISKNNKIFNSDYNKVDIISKNKIQNFKKNTKINIAKNLVKVIINECI
tara:strand:+ start:330 stop:1502 length:1173 start_codon:yes stop_codon:yes gene_type:complete